MEMKKLLLVIMSMILCTMFMAGCGKSAKEEAKDFNKEYFEQGYTFGIMDEITKKLNQYGNTAEADQAVVNSGIMNNITALKEKASKVELKNKELAPLKENFVKILDAQTNLFNDIKNQNYNNMDQSLNMVNRAIFDYKNKYSEITTGKKLPVFNTNIGQLYAYVASNVSFAVTGVSTPNYVGNEFFNASPQGKFIKVSIVAYNNQKDAITIDSNCFKLIDKSKREYSVSTNAMSALQLSEGHTKGFLNQINPGMALEAAYIFDVPANIPVNEFQVQARGGFTGDTVLMPCSINRTGY